MEKDYKKVGEIIKKLKAGDDVQCPQCRVGIVSSVNGSKYNFSCNKCGYRANLD